MHLPGNLGELTYCLNIHNVETWQELAHTLEGPVRRIKEALSPNGPFAVGLRVSADALRTLQNAEPRQHLVRLFQDGDFQAVTVNGFPYGRFHGVRVKEEVYLPDWRTAERLAYTCDLADLMAELSRPGALVSLSTVPGSFRPNATGAEADMAAAMLRAVAHLVALKERTGVTVALALEPEPHCFLETIADAVAFFQDHLFSKDAVATIAEAAGLGREDAEEALRRHLGLCYDVCHAAVEFEDARESLAALRTAGIPVHKLQLSAALRVPQVSAPIRARLTDFDEPTYLHQVVSRSEAGLARYKDLGDALRQGSNADGEEWRIHFHVPIFIEDLGDFQTTQNFLAEILDIHRESPISPHLEVETYTWDVLPEPIRTGSMEDAIVRELTWVKERLQG